MKTGARYAKIVQWSDEDGCYVGTVPDLIYGGCHGDDPRQVFEELCEIVDEVVALHEQDGTPLPEAKDALEVWPRSAPEKSIAAE